MPREEKVDRHPVGLTLGYPDVDSVQRLVAEQEWILVDEVFGQDIRFEVLIPADEIEEARRIVADRTRGSGLFEVRTSN